jgi:hypothetical protein
VVIAVCSYAVSATSLYALGVQAGYSWWQAAAVPVVADGPAIYGMFRIVSRSRRGAKGAGYGWLLVIAGTLASIGGNVAHARDDLVARDHCRRHPPGGPGHAGGPQGRRGRGHPARCPGRCRRRHARAGRPTPPGQHRSTRRPRDQPIPRDGGPSAPGGGRCPPGPPNRPPRARSEPGCRPPMPNHGRTASPGPPGPWPRPPAVAAAAPPASCNATAPRPRRTPGEVVALAVARRRRWLCLPRHPRPALHYPSPTAAASSRFPATTRLRPGPAARVGIRAAARSPSTPWVAWSPTGSGMPPVTGPAS